MYPDDEEDEDGQVFYERHSKLIAFLFMVMFIVFVISPLAYSLYC